MLVYANISMPSASGPADIDHKNVIIFCVFFNNVFT